MRGLLLLLAIGCTPSNNNGTSSSGSNGASGISGAITGSAGATGSTGGTTGGGTNGGTGGTPFSCTPFSSWCEGNMLLGCTRSGSDATGWDCTKNNSNLYTYYCADQCPNQPAGYGPCCALNMAGGTTGGMLPKPACNVSLTSPVVVSGNSHTFANGVSCSAPSPPECPGLGTFSAYFYNTPKTCPPSGSTLRIYVSRDKVTPGQTVTLPNPGVSVDYDEGPNDCSSWTGSFTFNSDTPSWKVTFNLQCSSGPNVHLAGTLNGDV